MIVLTESECKKIRGLIGMAKKAGALYPGLRATLDALRAGRCRLVIISADASPRTKRHVHDASRAITIMEVLSSEELGRWVGSSPIAVLSVTSTDFAKGIVKTIKRPRNGNPETTDSRRQKRRQR